MDISFTSGNEKFNYRVCAMIIYSEKILAMRMIGFHITICPAGELQSVKQQKMLLLERFKKNWASQLRLRVLFG